MMQLFSVPKLARITRLDLVLIHVSLYLYPSFHVYMPVVMARLNTIRFTWQGNCNMVFIARRKFHLPTGEYRSFGIMIGKLCLINLHIRSVMTLMPAQDLFSLCSYLRLPS